jgi:hypothetical protein
MGDVGRQGILANFNQFELTPASVADSHFM